MAFHNNFELSQIDLQACSNLRSIGNYAFTWTLMDSIDLSACTSLRSIGRYAFRNSYPEGIYLPVCAGYASYGWKDGENNTYMGGDLINNHHTLYFVDYPYTLNSGDLMLEDGLIISCDFDFSYKNIAIPQSTDGQTIHGIADKSDTTNGIFEGKGIYLVELPETLEYIGNRAFASNILRSLDFSALTELTEIGKNVFYNNNLDSLDLSACIALTRIWSEAFYANKLSSVDLSNFTALVFIGWFAFDDNYMSTFTLPTPDYPGFEYWQDIWENSFNASEAVSVDMEYYAVDVYSGLTFSISHGTEPIDSAMVYFYTNEYYSDENGEVIFPNILQGEYTYVVSAEGYKDAAGELLIGVDDVIEYVNMSGASVNEVGNENIRLYPNPGTNNIYIEIPPQAEDSRINLIDSRGRVLLQRQINFSPMLLSPLNLNPGIYFYTIYKDGVGIKKGKWVSILSLIFCQKMAEY